MDVYIENICDGIFKTNDYNNFKNKTILITGANGLIGGMLADFFHYLNKEKEFNIHLILTSKSKSNDLTRIKHLLEKKYVTYFDFDLSNSKQDIPDLPKIDYCFYSAGYATPAKFIDRPIETLNTNINGLYLFLELIMSNNLNAHFLYISSGEVYSANDNSSLYKETDIINIDLNNKRNFYKIGKISGELLINYFREKGLKASSIRTTICYGPGVLDTDNRVLSDLVRKGVNTGIIQLMDSGESTRKLLHITDFCLMALNIAQTCKHETYNVNGPNELSIFEIASEISDTLNIPVKRGNELNSITKYASNSVSMSIDRYEDEFGKHIFKSTKEGIKDFVNWYKTILNNY
jgi:dTDP-glucose 4,6-dehydratase/UDP-glucuronate decarboxylase